MSAVLPTSAGGRIDPAVFARIPIGAIRLGTRLRLPIYEDHDSSLLLLAAGTQVTASVLSRLKRRGITHVRACRSELARLLNPASARQHISRAAPKNSNAGDAVVRLGNSRWAQSPNSFLRQVSTHGTSGYDAGTTQRFAATFRDSLVQVETLFDGLAVGDVGNAAKLAAISSESLVKIAQDLDLFVATGISPATDKYPCKHSLQTGMLAMSIGTLLGLSQEELVELGIGCLIHDAGMLHISRDLIDSPKALSRIEFLEITKHPTVTFDLLQNARDVPLGSRMVAYQMHERCNGSGYPRRRHAAQIHPLAKIAAVADVFVALVSPRPHRPGMLPYYAIEHLVHGVNKGLYDGTVVRAMLHTVSLFPIGSFVETSDGRVGRVVRSNRDNYMKPVVELWNLQGTASESHLVNLAAEPGLQILRPLPGLQLEMTASEADLDFWE